VHAAGIHALAEAMLTIGETMIVAPERERSTTGHSLTLHKPLRLHKYQKNIFSVSGGPADCIYLGTQKVLKKKPDAVISGINHGANLGQDVFYSGTVSAAREAANLGIPALAVSLCLDTYKPGRPKHFATAGRAAREVFLAALDFWGEGNAKKGLKKWPKHLVLNVNVPNLPYNKIKGFRIAIQGMRYYGGKVVGRTDARGKEYFWIGGKYESFERSIQNSDCSLVDKGFVTITPLALDTTMLSVYRELGLTFEKKKKKK
jgi:5'-nucleotidase